MRLLFLFCRDPNVDPVAHSILSLAKTHYNATPSTFVVAGNVVLQAQSNGHQLFFAETDRFPSAIYPEISDPLNSQFPDVDMVGLVNWHEGANAPAKIFCAHSTADVTSGLFGPTSGNLLAATLLALECERKAAGLDDFRTLFEASHWSGTVYGGEATELLQSSGEYNQPGAEAKIVAAAKSSLEPPQLIVYHAGLKSAYKEVARKAAVILGIPCVSHKQLRAPDWQQMILQLVH